MVDTWKWYIDPSKRYIVCGVYHLLTTEDQLGDSTLSDLMSHKQVPLKVTLLGVFFENGYKRDILQQNPQLCIVGCGVVEFVDHLVLNWPLFGSIW